MVYKKVVLCTEVTTDCVIAISHVMVSVEVTCSISGYAKLYTFCVGGWRAILYAE